MRETIYFPGSFAISWARLQNESVAFPFPATSIFVQNPGATVCISPRVFDSTLIVTSLHGFTVIPVAVVLRISMRGRFGMVRESFFTESTISEVSCVPVFFCVPKKYWKP